jgi:hypothetical protein
MPPLAGVHVGASELACGSSRPTRPHELELIWKPFVPDDRDISAPHARPLTWGLLYLTTPAAGTGAFFGRAEVSAEAVSQLKVSPQPQLRRRSRLL